MLQQTDELLQIIRQAIDDAEDQARRLKAARDVLSGKSEPKASPRIESPKNGNRKNGSRKVSAATRRRMSEAQKARHARTAQAEGAEVA
jgi:hypothetical protein